MTEKKSVYYIAYDRIRDEGCGHKHQTLEEANICGANQRYGIYGLRVVEDGELRPLTRTESEAFQFGDTLQRRRGRWVRVR